MNWEDLTPKERRILLAQDVIDQLDTLNIQTGGYITGITTTSLSDDEMVTKGDCALIRQHCRMCARGSLLLVRIDRFNHISKAELREINCVLSSDLIDFTSESTTKFLYGAFSQLELQKIEVAFECTTKYMKYIPYEEKYIYDNHVRFGEQFSLPSERLRAIMQNIVDNDGDFCPLKEKVCNLYQKNKKNNDEEMLVIP